MNGFTNASGKSSGEIEYLNITLLTNQLSHSDLIGTEFTVNIEGGLLTKTYTWEGYAMTIDIPAYVNYTITFSEVEGYRKPSTVTYTAQNGNRRTLNAKYETEVVKVNVVADNGASMEGAQFEINGKTFTWQGNIISHKVAYGSVYSVIPQSFSGFSVPSSVTDITASQTEREITLTYIASALKVNILSNQDNDSTIAAVKATVYNKKYSHEGWLYLKEVQNGDYINTSELGFDGVGFYKIEFSDIEGYKTPESITGQIQTGIFEVTGTYQCELLTVNVSADEGSVSGFEVTISKQETVGVATKYTRLEYIESTGTQYIDTEIVPTQDTEMYLDIAFLSSAGTNVAGVRNSASDTTNRFGIITFSSSGNFGSFFGDSAFSTDIAVDTSRHNFTLKAGYITADGNEYPFTYEAFMCAYSITLGAWNNGEGGISYNNSRIYECKIYDNGTLVRDYTPALRSDGIAGLYDAVNDTFYASNGASNFVAGGKVEEIIATQTSVTGSYKIPFDSSYTVQASKVSGYDIPQSVTRIASTKSYIVDQQYTVITVRDLSFMDVYGNPIQRSTANCYVVRKAGQYKFPCVYGNAIKNGKVNTAAFTNNGGEYSHDFVNGIDSVINSPYISHVEGVLQNSDDSNVISDVSILREDECFYIQFKVNSIPSEGANVLLEAYSAMSAFPWIWHIWIWPHDLSPVEITNSTGVKYNIMPVNLASKYDSDGVHIKNWFYQWGRPTPMLLPETWNSSTDHSIGAISKSPALDSLSECLNHPNTFFYESPSFPYNWFGDKNYYNLWDAACTGTGNSDNDTVKTVYDPCPVGWKIPNGNTFTGFSKISEASGKIKYTRYSGDTVGVEFPLSGFRNSNSGSLSNVGSDAFVWLSSSSQDHAYDLGFNSNFVTPQNTNSRAYGSSVRPVQDDNIQLDVIMISFTINGTSYQAESGMTWFEWVNSDYNTVGATITLTGKLKIDDWFIRGELGVTILYTENIIGGFGYSS